MTIVDQDTVVTVSRRSATSGRFGEETKIGPMQLRQAMQNGWLTTDGGTVLVTVVVVEGVNAGHRLQLLHGTWHI